MTVVIIVQVEADELALTVVNDFLTGRVVFLSMTT